MRYLFVLFVLLLPLMPREASAQATTRIMCNSGNPAPNVWVDCSSAVPFPVSASVTLTLPTIGAAVPATGMYNAVNVAGTLRGWTAVNPSGSIYAGQVDLASVAGTTVLTGTGAQAAGSPRVTVATDQATNAGAALVKGGVGIVNGGSFYQAVAASQTATVLQSSTGAIGDYLSHCVIYPTSTSPGVVTVFDNANAAATNAIAFPGGASSVSNLAPIAVPVGAISTAGAWKVTTGANVSVVCFEKFS